MISAVIIGKESTIENFRTFHARASDALYKTLERLAIELTRKVKEEKLSGQVLKNRTGTLRRSINYRIEGTETTMTAIVGTNVAYAAIHEYGGTTKPHIIEPKNAKCLAFIASWGPGRGQGGKSFFARVNHPGSVMPERSFLRSALSEMQGQIRSELGFAVSNLGGR